MLFSVRACPRWSKEKADSFSAVSVQYCEAAPCHPPPLLTETEQGLAIFCRLRHLSYKQDAFWFCGALALKPGFPSVYRTALGFWGKTSPLGNKREDTACVWDPAFLSPVETSDTSIAKEHVGVPAPAQLSRNPARLPGQRPG